MAAQRSRFGDQKIRELKKDGFSIKNCSINPTDGRWCAWQEQEQMGNDIRFRTGNNGIGTMKLNKILCMALLFAVTWANVSFCADIYSDRVAAVVNGDVILESDIQKHKQPFMRNLTGISLGIIPPGKWPTEKELLDELIVIHLLEQEADKQGVKVDEKGVQATIDSIRKRNNNLTHDQFVLFLALNGLNYAEYRNVLKRQLKLTKLIAMEVQQKVPLSEEDAQLYWKKHRDTLDEQYAKLLQNLSPAQAPKEQAEPEIPTHMDTYVGGKVRLRQITLKIPTGAKKKEIEKVEAKAGEIYRQAMTGADFAQLAKKYSEDASAANGGDLGYMNHKDMVPQLQKLVERMKEGDITPPLGTPNSRMIFYLAEAKNRQVKRVAIPENIRKQLMEQRKKILAQRQDQEKAQSKNNPGVESEEDASEDAIEGEAKSGAAKKSVILTPAEEKEYKKARRKVIGIMRTERIQARLKEWVEELKKASIIEVKI